MADSFEEIAARALQATGKRNQAELAEFLEIRPASISEAKKRGNFPSDWMIKLIQKKKISPLWLLTGEGSRSIEIDTNLLEILIDGLEWKLEKDEREMSPETKARWVKFLYEQFWGKEAVSITREKVEEMIIQITKLNKSQHGEI